ncbi:MAG TPA: hypothetical protein VHQ47_10240 [Phycisphaerae bacterium]|nr:hypothetical protein [Phycisphaerae bacterium]
MATPMWECLAIYAALSLGFLAKLTGHGSDLSWVSAVPFFYCVSLVLCWVPVFVRMRVSWLWGWRVMMLALLAPFLVVFGQPEDRGVGPVLLAFSSFMIVAASWIMPARRRNEPRLLPVILVRAWSGAPILEDSSLFVRGFPVEGGATGVRSERDAAG